MTPTHPRRPTLALLLAGLLCVSAASCGDEGGQSAVEADNNDPGGKTDDGGAAAAFEGREDPVANYLRGVTTAEGVVPGDWQTVLDGVAEEMGCTPESTRSFVILLSNKQNFPRNMFTVCSDDPVEASRFFLSTQSDDGTLSDIEPRDIKMYAWDDEARTYRLYEMKPNGEPGEGMRLTIEPGQCRSCHTGPAHIETQDMPFVPIMNELVNPWTLWNAEPDFRSHRFEDTIDPKVAEAEVYSAMTEEGTLDSAANFEKHIREAMSRVTSTRLRARRDDADVQESLNLLRPLFCDETLNYVSENHDNGELHSSVIVDDSIRRLFLNIRPDNWPYDWLNDGKLRMPLPEAGQVPIAVMPVRGEQTLQIENALVSRNVLTPQQVLQVRALDWKHPATSDLRCELYEASRTRIEADPPDVSGYRRNNDLLPVLFEELMKLEVEDDQGEVQLVSLLPEDPDTLFSIPDIWDEAAFDALFSGQLEPYAVSVDAFGQQLEDWFKEIEASGDRAWLEQERTRRGCVASANYPSAPDIPDLGSCDN